MHFKTLRNEEIAIRSCLWLNTDIDNYSRN